jgi:hypothetical protein
MKALTKTLMAAAANYNSHHGVKLKKISEHGDYNLGAGIYKDSDTKEYVVFFVDGGEYLHCSDYHTEDRADAEGTVQHFLHPHKGELADTGVTPQAEEEPAPVRNAAPRGFARHPDPLMQGLLTRVIQ